MAKYLNVKSEYRVTMRRAGYKVGKRRKHAVQYVHPCLHELWVKELQVAGWDREEECFEYHEYGWSEQVISDNPETK